MGFTMGQPGGVRQEPESLVFSVLARSPDYS